MIDLVLCKLLTHLMFIRNILYLKKYAFDELNFLLNLDLKFNPDLDPDLFLQNISYTGFRNR